MTDNVARQLVRRADHDDLDAVGAIFRPERFREPTNLSGPYSLWVAVEETPDRQLIVGALEAGFDSDFTGRVDPDPGLPHGYASLMAVLSSYRRRGTGRMLMLAYARECTSRGVQLIVANPATEGDNTGRLAFFASIGFVQSGLGHHYYLLAATPAELLRRTASV